MIALALVLALLNAQLRESGDHVDSKMIHTRRVCIHGKPRLVFDGDDA